MSDANDVASLMNACMHKGYCTDSLQGLQAANLEIQSMREKIGDLTEQLEQHEEAARILWGFQQAYPTDIFPEIEDWKEVNNLMEHVDLSLSRISASNMRHVTKCITEALPQEKSDD